MKSIDVTRLVFNGEHTALPSSNIDTILDFFATCAVPTDGFALGSDF